MKPAPLVGSAVPLVRDHFSYVEGSIFITCKYVYMQRIYVCTYVCLRLMQLVAKQQRQRATGNIDSATRPLRAKGSRNLIYRECSTPRTKRHIYRYRLTNELRALRTATKSVVLWNQMVALVGGTTLW